MPDEDTAQTSPPELEPAVPLQAAAEALPTETQTAQIPVSEPFDPTHDKPLPPEPEPTPPAPQPAAAPQSAPAAAAPVAPVARDLLVKARATIQDRKAKKLEKIMAELDKKGKLTNDEVEKLLHVSDATATRYLSALEKQGKITQVGKTGHAVTYTKL